MKTVLLIEDNQAMQHLLQNVLCSNGYRVNSIHDGTDLARKISNVNADIIVSDILLPNILGLELLDIYKNVQTPIVIMSSMDEEDARYFVKTINALAYIKKPFHSERLLNTLNKLHSNPVKQLK